MSRSEVHDKRTGQKDPLHLSAELSLLGVVLRLSQKALVKKALFIQLQMVVNSCTKADVLIVLGDFIAILALQGMVICESYVGLRGSESRDDSSLMVLDFAKSRRL